MAMYPCKACKKKNWKFEIIGVEIKATCNSCGAVAQWKSAKLERKSKRIYEPFKPHFSDEEIRSQTGDPPW